MKEGFNMEISDYTRVLSTITQYVKKGKRNKKVGMFIAQKIETNTNSAIIVIGHSLCNAKDPFSKEVALKIAKGRSDSMHSLTLPSSLVSEFEKFYERCRDFFQASQILENYEEIAKKHNGRRVTGLLRQKERYYKILVK